MIANQQDALAVLNNAIETLPEVQRTIIKEYFFEKKTRTALNKQLNLSKQIVFDDSLSSRIFEIGQASGSTAKRKYTMTEFDVVLVGALNQLKSSLLAHGLGFNDLVELLED